MLRSATSSDLVILVVVAHAVLLANAGSETDKRKAPISISSYEVDVSDDKPIHVTNERFLSVTLDTKLMTEHWMNFNFSSAKLQTLTRALFPAYLRLGGKLEDILIFRNSCGGDTPSDPPLERRGIYFCPEDWEGINKFCEDTGLKLIFGLNLLLRTNEGGWDPSNAEKLLDFNTYEVCWELGNEPNADRVKFGISLSGSQIGVDFNLLRSVLGSRPRYARASVYGPDVSDVGGKHTTSVLRGFLSKTNTTNATTFHSYYLNGKTATVDDFLDPETLDGLLPGQIDLVESVVTEFRRQGSKVWLGETGSAYGGGAENISDRFVAGFLFLDKLGMSAKMGLDVVNRQTYYGGHYTMLDLENLDPKPDYWIAYIYKRLVGPQVLQATITAVPSLNNKWNITKSIDKQYLRVYAHCTARSQSGYVSGAVTLIMLNMNKNDSAIITLLRNLSDQTIQQYLLTPYGPDGMTSLKVNLNGLLLQLKNDTVLPDIEPVQIKRGNPIRLPPLSYGFYVIPMAKAKACMT